MPLIAIYKDITYMSSSRKFGLYKAKQKRQQALLQPYGHMAIRRMKAHHSQNTKVLIQNVLILIHDTKREIISDMKENHTSNASNVDYFRFGFRFWFRCSVCNMGAVCRRAEGKTNTYRSCSSTKSMIFVKRVILHGLDGRSSRCRPIVEPEPERGKR